MCKIRTIADKVILSSCSCFQTLYRHHLLLVHSILIAQLFSVFDMATSQLHTGNGATDTRNGGQTSADESVAGRMNGFHHPATNGDALLRAPLELTGLLDKFQSFDVTPVIGTEFPNVQLTDWLRAPNSDELLRELAITISQRGVAFFRAQDGLNDDLQKELGQRLGELAGKPKTSGLHIHPLINFENEDGAQDRMINIISTNKAKNPAEDIAKTYYMRKGGNLLGWHTDISYEPVPSDYTILRLTELPSSGGDTLWASSYGVFDRISKPYQQFLETLTANYAQSRYPQTAKEKNFEIYSQPRGAPENTGTGLSTVHPVIRTNPVTGWKTLYAIGNHVKGINGLTETESTHLIDWFTRLIVENHDLQVRNRWQNPNDVAIWDNRAAYHTATFDFEGLGPRTGHRVVGLGERPYLDPNSMSKRDYLAQRHG